MRKTFVAFEMMSGTVHESVRVLAADKVHAEATCRKQGWTLEDGPRLGVTITYATALRTKATDASSIGDFMEQLVDYEMTNAEPTEDEPDPT